MRRRSPIVRAAALRSLEAPGWAGLLTLAAAMLIASVLAPPFFVRAAHDAALQEIRAAAEKDTYRVAAVDLRASWSGRLAPAVFTDLRARLDSLPGYDAPVVTSSGNGPDRTREPVLLSGSGRSATATLWARDGAIETLGGDPGQPGIWVPDDVAADLGISVGDSVRMAVRGVRDDSLGREVPLQVLGTFEPAPGSLLPQDVLDLGVRPVDLPLAGVNGGAFVLAITDHTTLDRVSLRIGDIARHLADLQLAPRIAPDEAEGAYLAQKALQQESYEIGSPLATGLAQALPMEASLGLATDLRDVLDDADVATTSSRSAAAPFVRATQVMSLLLTVAVYVLWMRSRTAEQWTLTGWGLGPPSRGFLAALEVLPCLVAAVPAGAGLAVAGVLLAGPPGRLAVRDQLGATAATAGLAAILVLALATTVAVAAALRQEREAIRLPRALQRRVPWDVAVVAAAAVVGVAVLTLDLEDRATSPLAALFPLAVAAGVAVVVMWLAAALPVPRIGREGSVTWLALRRSAASTTTAATVVLAIGLTVLGYGIAVRDGVSVAVADKAAALSGAQTTIDLGEQLQGRPLAEGARVGGPGAVVVYRRGVVLPPEFGERPLLMADPEALADAVDWGARLDRTGRAALREMAREPEPDQPVPVLLAGTTDRRAGERLTLTFNGSTSVDAVVVAAVEAFPGSESESGIVTVVASTKALLAALPRPFRPSTTLDETSGTGVFSAAIWSRAPADEVRGRLADAGLEAKRITLLAQTRARPELLAADWAVGYLLPLGLAAMCLVVGTGLLLARRMRERDRVSDVMLRHMGWTWTALTAGRLCELAATLCLAALAAAVATLALTLGPTVVETSALLPPVARPALSGAGVVWWLAAWVVVALSAGTALALGGSRRRAGEVLRDPR